MNKINKFIQINNNGIFIPVDEMYSYTYDTGKCNTVLRLKVDSKHINLDEIKSAFSNNNTIDYYEKEVDDNTDISEDDLKITYTDFYGEFKCSYVDTEGTWNIEVVKTSQIDKMIEENKDNMMTAYMAIADLYEMKINAIKE